MQIKLHMLDNITWNHLSEHKFVLEQFVLEYFELFNCVQTIKTLVRKQISSNSFKNNISYKLFTYKSSR